MKKCSVSFLCCVVIYFQAIVLVYCDTQINFTSSRIHPGKYVQSKESHQGKIPIKNSSSKSQFYRTYGNLIIGDKNFSNDLNNSDNIVMETQVTSQVLNMNDPTVNSTNKNIIDWFLGVVGFKPEDNQKPTEPSNLAPDLKCSKCTCGVALKHKRIVGGVETIVNEFPWMVALQYNNRFYCGASLINNKYILTAAHCVNGFRKERLSAVFLDHDRSNSYETTTFTRRINKILLHKSYGQQGNYNNDIALLQLDQEVSLNDMTRPVCLPPTGKSFTGQNGVAIGWGATAEHGQVSNTLREVTVPIMSNIDCRKTGYNTRITDNMLCAGFSDGKKDSCQGDSGGPLLHKINDYLYEIVGIVSWGEGCAKPNYPGVYTRVNRYITWIMSNTKDACYC